MTDLMCNVCGQAQDTPSCATREHWLPARDDPKRLIVEVCRDYVAENVDLKQRLAEAEAVIHEAYSVAPHTLDCERGERCDCYVSRLGAAIVKSKAS